eukprot:354274_1
MDYIKICALSILLLIMRVSYSAKITGSSFESTESGYYIGDEFWCIANVNCVLKCYGDYACNGATIYGPEGASLSVFCDSNYYNQQVQTRGSCYSLDIYANLSTSLTVKVANAKDQFINNDIWVPNNGPGGGYTADIECGVVGPYTDTSYTGLVCGWNTRIWAVEGWNDVNYYYYGSNSWAIVQQTDASQRMICGKKLLQGDRWNFNFECFNFGISSGRYQCKQFDDCDAYVMPSNEPTKKPTTRSPTKYPTKRPTVPPTTAMPTTSPTQSTVDPTISPTTYPTLNPTAYPTQTTTNPSISPTAYPTQATTNPSISPTSEPTVSPTNMSNEPTVSPTESTFPPTQLPTTFSPTYSPITYAPTTVRTTTVRKYILEQSSEKLTWNQAEDLCQSIHSSHLATIITDNDYSTVLDMMESEIITNNGYLTAWIGLNDRFEEGQWTWADGSKCVTSDGSCSQ